MKSITLLIFVLLSSCSGQNGYQIPAAYWDNVKVIVESRPSPVRAGMNEFLIITSGAQGRPVFDLVVSVKTEIETEWKQAIQDGHVGVYRRALLIKDPQQDRLHVELKQGSKVHKLVFPLLPEPTLVK